MITLDNGNLTVKIDEQGAQLRNIFCPETQIEYLWQADPKFWGRTSPILFPIVGRLKDNKYTYQNESFEMEQHGFARDANFTVVDHKDTYVIFELKSNAETLAMYPFEFELRVAYELTDDNQVTVNFVVSNHSEFEMLYSIGAHPGFNVPLTADDTFETTNVSVEPNCKFAQIPLVGPYNDAKNPKTLDFTQHLNLDHELFKQDALILDLQKQPVQIKLQGTNSEHGVNVNVDQAPYTGIWSPYPVESPFVCIEPWWGIADSIDTNQRIEDKMAMNKLLPSASEEHGYSISVF
ncbi:aldose 1-epimerase [Paucilactobacillus oligofermentans DSM 15707 = LMG 22743]|uniref:Aldose 1-epimerase n=1 Tax=Paucilactobacillus oligofermentans DSM 15707 = LMG 22743 TaxID=1423778 RepID=A0A0R1RMX6_9LACO|nr:aldose 1-epimerase family protein [Paucilactobacillus oligofermentans]KRL54843.1 aldose 1-epimerase [Paucilactobacillus oligofermentans DSM 15707 = LMG 22743]CUS26242.1 Aldose 1-epimerase family protein [Paucilactobacillus oligofermentans DSM 15707 = LMG 22743]